VCADSIESTIQLGVYASDIVYTEPSLMTEEGSLIGLVGKFSLYDEAKFQSLEVYYSSGDMDYDGSGTISNIPDKMFELRGLIGGNLKLSSTVKIIPYAGLGYRNLNDDSSGMLSSTSASGYEREQIYLYIPIGIEFKKRRNFLGFMLSGRIEYDYLINGTNHSYLSTVGSGYDDITLNQHDGHGYRASIGLTRTLGHSGSITIEPFYRYWHISDSEVTYDSMHRGWLEPNNYSKEFGISLLISM
jgi:hypothetical protein